MSEMSLPPSDNIQNHNERVRNDWESARPQLIRLAVDEILLHHLHIREDTVERVLEDIAAPSRGRSKVAGSYGAYRKQMPAEENRALVLAILDATRRASHGLVAPASRRTPT